MFSGGMGFRSKSGMTSGKKFRNDSGKNGGLEAPE